MQLIKIFARLFKTLKSLIVQADVDANTIEAYIELEKAIATAETQRWKLYLKYRRDFCFLIKLF